MYDKIGLHIIGGWSGNVGKPRLIKLVNPSVEYVSEIRNQVGKDCLIVVRWTLGEQPLDQPLARAQQFVAKYQSQMLQMRDRAGSAIAFEGYNEIPDEFAASYCTFEVERLRLMHNLGLRSVVGNFSVGVPDISVWKTYKPMLDALRPGDFVGLHEYWPDTAGIDNPWWCGRWAKVPELQGKPIIVTECGRDAVEGKGQPGWHKTCDSITFLEDLRKYNALLEQSPNVLGAVVFTVGGTGWGDFDPSPVWPQVVAGYSNVAWKDPSYQQSSSTGQQIVQVPSPNFGYPQGTKGRNGYKVLGIVFHIAEGSLSALDAWVQNPSSSVSYHFGVGKGGEIHQYVSTANAAWHAGKVNKPTWPLIIPGVNPNLYTVGIGLEGHSGDPIPEKQYSALLALTRLVLLDTGLKASRETLIGHFQIDGVDRLFCPGPTFPWERLYKDLGVVAQEPPKEVKVDKVTLYKLSWDSAGIPFNKDAAFAKYAMAHNLGVPFGKEFDWVENGATWRGQAFPKCLICCRVGDWGNIEERAW